MVEIITNAEFYSRSKASNEAQYIINCFYLNGSTHVCSSYTENGVEVSVFAHSPEELTEACMKAETIAPKHWNIEVTDLTTEDKYLAVVIIQKYID